MNPGESTTKSFPGTAAPQAASPGAVTLADLPSPAPPGNPAGRVHLRLRWTVTLVLAGLTALVAVRLAMVDGLIRRVSIEGPSMAPTFVGAHHRVTCGDCDFVFRCDATNVPATGLAVCPNCGYRSNELTAANLQAGEQVLIDRWKLLGRAPQRGDVIAARQPSSTDGLIVKRVAALPGERLEIRGGDLFVNGQIVRKSLAEFRAVRMLVHDNAFRPLATQNLPPRWRPATSDSRWQRGGFSFETTPVPPDKESMSLDWLEYHHWHGTASLAPRTKVMAILDNDSFNQNLSRQLNPVRDVFLSCRVKVSGEGELSLAVQDGAVRREVRFDAARRRVLLLEDGRQILEKPLAIAFSQPTAVEFGLCDQQVLLAVAGRMILREPYESAPRAGPTGSSPPLAIGARAISATVSNLQVWRDLYYLEPNGTPRPWRAEAELTASEFALVGDNPPVSIDVRHWPGSGGTRESDLFGRVERPFWAAAK